MNDTCVTMTDKVRQLMKKKTGLQRMKMGLSMWRMSRRLVIESLRHQETKSDHTVRQQLFLRFYGANFDSTTRQRILQVLK